VNRNHTVSAAVISILSAHASAAYAADPADRRDAAPTIEEVIVTAQHREESIQNVPIAMQALTAETLSRLSVNTFEDYVKYVPNVTFAGNGPGQSNIYMRGLATPSSGIEGSGAASGKPECCYTRFDFAYDIVLLLRYLHIGKTDVAGHSLGSIVAETFAELWPDHARRLILISSTGTFFGTQGWLTDVERLTDPIDPNSAFMRDWWNQSISINPEVFSSRQRQDAAAIPASVWRAVADQSLVGVVLGPMLPRVRSPTLLIWGARDTLVPEEGREALRTGIAGSRVKIFDSLGHDLFWEDPSGVSSVITTFLTAR
jgi:pimeloyl-ACP methyl ester carboxylesterase